MLINSLVCWLLYVESVSHRIGLWWLIVYYNHWNGLLTLILYPFEKSSAIERSQNDLTTILLLDVLRDRYLSPWCSSWPLSFSLMFFLTAIFHLDVLLDRCLSPWCSAWLLSPWCSSWPLSFSLMFLLVLVSLFFIGFVCCCTLSDWCACSKFEWFRSVDVSVNLCAINKGDTVSLKNR